MAEPDTILFAAPNGISLRVKLLTAENPSLAKKIQSAADEFFATVLHHVTFSGETIYMPSRIVDDGPGNWVTRKQGDVYLYKPSATICVTYGSETPESAPVNKFGEVHQDDIEKLVALGKSVKERTVTNVLREVLVLTIQPAGIVPGHWRLALRDIQEMTEKAWLAPPGEIQHLLATAKPATIFFVNSYLLTDGPNIASKLLTISKDPEVTLHLMRRITATMYIEPFDHFNFLGDLGLPPVAAAGKAYIDALPTLENLDQYRELTGALTYFLNRMQKWMHLGNAHTNLAPGETIQIVEDTKGA